MAPDQKNDIYGEYRAQIDEIDDRLLELLNRRATAALEICRLKRLHNHPVFVPEREQEILHRLARDNPGPLPNQAVQTVFRAIIEQVRALEETQNTSP